MSDIIVKKENDLVTIQEATKENTDKLSNQIHLCWKCQNARVTLCPKIEDCVKKSIEEYDFITDGHQVYDENGQLDKFIVCGCKKFAIDKHEIPTQEQKEYYKRLKEKMKTAYFGTETIEEANIVQYRMAKKNQLNDIRGSMLSDKEYMILTQRK